MAEAFNEYFVQIGYDLAIFFAVSDVTFDQFVSPTLSEISRFKLLWVNSFQRTKRDHGVFLKITDQFQFCPL